MSLFGYQQSRKYLYISCEGESKEMGSKVRNLELTINTALSVKRIPIIRENKVSVVRNGVVEKVPIDWERYVDLSATKIFKVESGRIKELSDTLQYIHERDFDFHSYAKDQVRYVDIEQLYDEENEQYPVVCLSNHKNVSVLKKVVSKFHKNLNYLNNKHIDSRLSFLVIFSPSQEVNYLTNIVLDHFGTTQSDLELLSGILHHRVRLHLTNIDMCRENLNYYACMNVQHKGSMKMASMFINRYIAKKKIKITMHRIRHRQRREIPFYIISNIREDGYFDFLKPQYDIYRYTDFKELRERFTQGEVIDYNLLYMVENNIMRHALVKILPPKMNRFTFEGPWSISGLQPSLEELPVADIKGYIGWLTKWK